MSDLQTAPPSSRLSRFRPLLTLTRPMFPEGLATLVLLVALVTVAGMAVEAAEWTRIVIPVTLVAFLAALFGSVAAKLRLFDSFAHMMAILAGAALSFLLVVRGATFIEGGPRARAREIAVEGLAWYVGDRIEREMEAHLVSLLMGIIVWLVGYLAAWTLFRRGWLPAAVLLPGFLVLVTIGYDEDPDTGFLAAFGFLAVLLIARHNFFTRQREWRYRRVPSPSGLPTRFALAGLAIALVATSSAWRAPASLSQATLQPLVGEISAQAVSLQEAAADWMRDDNGASPDGVQVTGSYTSFGDSFAVGGPLNLTDQPQVLVSADEAPYLIAQRYDSYSGRGWYSTTETTFNPEGPDGRRYAPEMTFAPNQGVPLSDLVTGERSSLAVEITPLAPTGDRLFTVDTYESSSISAAVRMSWQQLEDEAFDLTTGDTSLLPRDLQRMGVLLQSAELTGPAGEFGPTASDAGEQAEIDQERSQLRGRFLEVRWTADDSGAAQQLVVSGQVPVYDDVEAVFSSDATRAGETYGVIAAASFASAEQLQQAGTAYPEWVSERYLSLPDSITPRTVELTLAVTAAAASPYDKARAIEQYLRTTITYDESVQAPPGDAEIVDYLLFERQRGFCEYSATAMSVMLRALGIPARVAVGFYPGDYDEGQGGYLYLQENAHAWVEAYMPGYGWIPFEPTSSQPLIEEGSGEEPTPPPSEPTPIAAAETEEAPTPTVEASPLAGDEGDTAAPQVTPEDGGKGRGWQWAAAAAATVVLVVSAGWMLWSLPLCGLSGTGALYARLRRVGRWLGVAAEPNATPREFGRSFVERVPESRPQVERIVASYELDRYGPERAGPGWLRASDEAWHAVRHALPRWLLRRGRT